MPTISDGLAGLIDCVFSAVFRWRPPMTRSYSRPSSLRTFSIAGRMRRAFSGLLKSTDGSFLNASGIWALLMVAEMRLPSRAGVVVVAISASSQMLVSAVLVDAVRSGGMRQKRRPISNDKRGRDLCLVRLKGLRADVHPLRVVILPDTCAGRHLADGNVLGVL